MGCRSSTRKVIKTRIDQIKFDFDNLRETGMIQYFYHCPDSDLPIRDVLNKQKQGHKTEPHIEIGAENYIAKCYQPNIKKFVCSSDKYLFLITTCKNIEINKKIGKNKTNQFIVGYIIKEDAFEIDGHTCVRGSTFIYSFEDSILVKDLFGWNFSRRELLNKPFVDEQKTREILMHFGSKESILEECIKKIIELDKRNSKDKKTCRVLRGLECKFKEECLRWKVG